MKIIYRAYAVFVASAMLSLVGCSPSAKDVAYEKHMLERAEAQQRDVAAADATAAEAQQRASEAAAAEAQRQAAEAMAAEARRIALTQDCEKLDNEQRRLNEDYAQWKRIYPISSSALISCTKSAKNE